MLQHVVAGVVLSAAVSLALPVAAQTYPVKPVRMVLPFPAGGPTDILGRILGQKLSEQLGQPVVQDNRPGAGGNLGTELAARAAPDGYTLILAADSLVAINPHLYKQMPLDTLKDLTPV